MWLLNNHADAQIFLDVSGICLSIGKGNRSQCFGPVGEAIHLISFIVRHLAISTNLIKYSGVVWVENCL